MKKLLFLISFIITLNAMAQNEHFTFRGMPIDGPCTDFSKELTKMGYISPTSNTAYLEGKFIGKSCNLIILESEYTKKIYAIAINFYPVSNWDSLKNDFDEIVDMYNEKYGEPVKKIMSFSSPYNEGDGYEMLAIRKDKCCYFVNWETDNGEIFISISKDCYISIFYTDKKNAKLHREAQETYNKNQI